MERDLEALQTSFRPSRIAFLRDRIGHQLKFGLNFGKMENDNKGLSNAAVKTITHIPNVSKRYQDILAGRQRPLPRTKCVANQGEQAHTALNSADTTAELTGKSLMNEDNRRARMDIMKRRKIGMKLKLKFS